ncbi:GH25 family lysozyme, partial [Bartonella sp. CL63NXGY]|uniref:GH25 family lysozyme n=1 Tax=Bartonella sp. CL63NXGY TaxID=3243538 RepID=UPI0035D0F7C0
MSEFQDPKIFPYQAAKDAGIDTLIIRAGYHTRQDKHVKEHIANAKKYGFKWHLYHYWMNGGTEIAWAIQNAKDLGLSSKQYLFLDVEDKSLPADWNGQFAQFRKQAVNSFKVGLYCSDSPYRAKFSDSQLRQLNVLRWIAAYSYEPANYDIWQMSGAGSGGFGSYTGDIDRDYVATSILNDYAKQTEPDQPEDEPFTPPADIPMAFKNIVLQDMIVDGIRGLGCSPDNGITNRIYWTIFGRKYYQEDGDRIWPFIR